MTFRSGALAIARAPPDGRSHIAWSRWPGIYQNDAFVFANGAPKLCLGGCHKRSGIYIGGCQRCSQMTLPLWPKTLLNCAFVVASHDPDWRPRCGQSCFRMSHRRLPMVLQNFSLAATRNSVELRFGNESRHDRIAFGSGQQCSQTAPW